MFIHNNTDKEVRLRVTHLDQARLCWGCNTELLPATALWVWPSRAGRVSLPPWRQLVRRSRYPSNRASPSRLVPWFVRSPSSLTRPSWAADRSSRRRHQRSMCSPWRTRSLTPTWWQNDECSQQTECVRCQQGVESVTVYSRTSTPYVHLLNVPTTISAAPDRLVSCISAVQTTTGGTSVIAATVAPPGWGEKAQQAYSMHWQWQFFKLFFRYYINVPVYLYRPDFLINYSLLTLLDKSMIVSKYLNHNTNNFAAITILFHCIVIFLIFQN